MHPRRLRVLIADDYPLILTALRRLLSLDYEVVEAVEDGAALVDAAVRLQPDVVVASVSLPRLNGLDACRQIMRSIPLTMVILTTTMLDGDDLRDHAREAGAHACIQTDRLGIDLPDAIKRLWLPLL